MRHRGLIVVSKSAIDEAFHDRSPADSALDVRRLVALAGRMHAKETVDGTVSRTAEGFRLDARLLVPAGGAHGV